MWLVEYSQQQDSFYVGDLLETLRENLDLIAAGRSNDYTPFAVCVTEQLAYDTCARMRWMQSARFDWILN